MKIKVTKNLPKNATVISSGALIINNEGKYVFEHRTKDCPYSPDGIEIFGGVLENNESPINCLHRELIEEINFDFKKQGLVPELIGYQESLTDKTKFNARYVIKDVDSLNFIVSEESAGILKFNSFSEAVTQKKHPVGFSVQSYIKLLKK